MEFFNLIFKSFWTFVGFSMLMYLTFNFMLLSFNRFLRHWTIKKHGYPPEWCDADGDKKNKITKGMP